MRVFSACALLLLLVFPVNAKIKTEPVAYKQGDTTLNGFLYYDDANRTPRPGVLVVHEWWGLNDHAKAKATELAQKGYVAFALDMYGEGKTTEHPQEATEWMKAVSDEMRYDRFLAAHELLRDHELTEPAHIAAIGYCFGGGVVLRMATAGADLAGVVSFHGSLPTEMVEPGTIKASILVCHGAADPFVEAEQIGKFQQVLTDAGADWQFVSYGGARHSFTVKDAESRGIPALQYNEAAAHRSWQAMLDFFDEIFHE